MRATTAGRTRRPIVFDGPRDSEHQDDSQRGAVAVDLVYRGLGSVRFVSVHTANERGLNEALARHVAGATVLVGDFNTVATDEALDPIRRRATDAFRHVNPTSRGGTFPVWNEPETRGRVDYVFTSGAHVLSAWTVGGEKYKTGIVLGAGELRDPKKPTKTLGWHSDHLGVMAVLEIDPR